MSGSAPEGFLTLVFVFGGVRNITRQSIAAEWPWPDARFAAEHLTEHGKEGQELLDAADPKQGQG